MADLRTTLQFRRRSEQWHGEGVQHNPCRLGSTERINGAHSSSKCQLNCLARALATRSHNEHSGWDQHDFPLPHLTSAVLICRWETFHISILRGSQALHSDDALNGIENGKPVPHWRLAARVRFREILLQRFHNVSWNTRYPPLNRCQLGSACPTPRPLIFATFATCGVRRRLLAGPG